MNAFLGYEFYSAGLNSRLIASANPKLIRLNEDFAVDLRLFNSGNREVTVLGISRKSCPLPLCYDLPITIASKSSASILLRVSANVLREFPVVIYTNRPSGTCVVELNCAMVEGGQPTLAPSL